MDKLTIYRKPMGENLFEEEFTVEALSQMGNPLERLSSLVDFEMFRPVQADRCCAHVQSHIPSTLLWLGRPPDSVLDNRPHQFPPVPWEGEIPKVIILTERLPHEFMN